MPGQGRGLRKMLKRLLITCLTSLLNNSKFARWELSPAGDGTDSKTDIITITKMLNLTKEKVQEIYIAPACSMLPFYSDAAICETSYDGEIEPGTGVDWDEL